MDWLFDNLGKLAPLALFVFYLLSALKGNKREEEEDDPQAAERARKIQEEIRRKILERQQQNSGRKSEPVFEEEEPEVHSRQSEERGYNPFAPERPAEEREVYHRPIYPDRPKPKPARKAEPEFVFEEPVFEQVEDEYERQKREIEEKMRKARELRKKAELSAKKSIRRTSSPSMSGSKLRKEILVGLQGPTSLKKAVVLKEVLDTPVGLR